MSEPTVTYSCNRCGRTLPWGSICQCPVLQPPAPCDAVNHPPHYTAGRFEVIDVIEDWKLNFHLGNAIKYVARAGKKGDALEDLKKAAWYLAREIARREGGGE